MTHSDTLAFKRELCSLMGLKRGELHVYRKGNDMVIERVAPYKLPCRVELFVYYLTNRKWYSSIREVL